MKKLLFLCALSSSSLSFSTKKFVLAQALPDTLKMRKKPDAQNSTLSQYEWKNASDRVGSVYWEGILKSEHRDNSLLPVKLSRRMSFGEYSKS